MVDFAHHATIRRVLPGNLQTRPQTLLFCPETTRPAPADTGFPQELAAPCPFSQGVSTQGGDGVARIYTPPLLFLPFSDPTLPSEGNCLPVTRKPPLREGPSLRPAWPLTKTTLQEWDNPGRGFCL